MEAPPGKLLKVSIMLRRKKGLSEEEFHKHYREIHGNLAAPWLKRYGIVKYNQYHTTESTRNLALPFAQLAASDLATGLTVGTFDCVAQFWMEKLDMFFNAMKDPYYQKVAEDEHLIFDMEDSLVLVGWEEDVLG